MQHVKTPDNIQLNVSWLAIGTFDGVHRGHQEIIRKLTAGAHAEKVPAVVLTFDPHPVAVVRPDKAPHTLTTVEERVALFEQLGVDVVITYPFNQEVAAQTAKSFLSHLRQRLGFTHFWVGHDFAMGHNREGNIPALYQLGKDLGYQLHVVDPVNYSGKIVSSSQIRALLAEGRAQEASELLGRPYQLSGQVIEGAKRGRTIGIPTANLAIKMGRVIPSRGVYACLAHVNGKSWKAVTNIGLRPTFETVIPTLTIEAHLLDFSRDLYGQTMNLEFISRIREEKKFTEVEALIAQIQQDIKNTKDLLNT
jgi:riboflavin kinase / FMN adenylyltransferase